LPNAEYAKAQALDDNADILSQWILVAHQAGRTADAQRMLNDLLQRAKTHYVAPFYIAAAYIAVGENDRGFDWLQKALAERNELLVFIKVAPSFRSVRRPRFIEVLRRIGLL
jgi:tetratricopeptide (TPR) repeat protein